MTPEEKQEIIDAVIPDVISQLLSDGRDITGLNSVESLDGISTFPAVLTTTTDGVTTKAIVSVPISLLTQAVQDVIDDAVDATTDAQSAAAGWAAAAHKTKGDITIINGNITNLQDADKSLSSLTAYAECSTAANVSAKAVTVPFFSLPTNGGCLHVKMANANTAVSGVTLNINATGAKDLLYNGSAVSTTNTWEDNEVLQIYYDGTNYQASNAQGGGGSADRVSFDNSQSGLNAENVQEAIDEVVGDVESNASAIEEVNEKFNFYEELNLSNNSYSYRLTSDKRWDEQNTGEHYYIPCTPGTVFRLKRSSTSENNCNYAFLTSHNYTSSNAAVSSIYEEALPYLAPQSEIVITAPEDAIGLAINKVVASGDVSPNKVERKSTTLNNIINELVTMPEGEVQKVTIFDDLSKFVDQTVAHQSAPQSPVTISYANNELTVGFTSGNQGIYVDLGNLVQFNHPYSISLKIRRTATGSNPSQTRQLCVGFSMAYNKTDEFITTDPSSNEITVSGTITPINYQRLYIGMANARNGGPTYVISELKIEDSITTVNYLTKAAQMIYELKEAVEHGGGGGGSSESESIISGTLPHGTVLFTSDNFKTGDSAHISLSRESGTTYAFVEFYDANNTRLAICGLLSNNLQNDFEGDFLIPSGFKYASLYAKERSGNTQINSSCTINAIYRVPSEWGAYKFGNPMFETIASYNAGRQNQISTENIFEYSSSPKKVRCPATIITNAGTVLATCLNTPNAQDSDPTNIILARKASGDSEWSYQTVIPFDSTNNRKVMNVAFIVDRAGAHGNAGRIYIFGLAIDINNSTNKGMAKDALTSEIAEVFVYSDDDGVTWSAMQFLDKSLWDTSNYKWMCNGPANGIVTQDGTMAIGCMGIDNDGNWRSCVMYKKVGQDWHFSSLTSALGDNEDVVFEGLTNNEIYLNCRNEQNSVFRNLYKLDTTTDELATVYNGFYNENQVHLALQCCITKCTINGDTCYLMSYADPTGEFTESNIIKGRRNRITVWASADGIRWTRVLRLTGTIETAGYSMISCYNGKCVVVYENDDRTPSNKYKCERVGFADLTPALELLHQSALMCGDTPEGRIHRVREYQISIN